MKYQELLDELVIGQSPLTGRVYVGLPDNRHKGRLKVKTDFTDRLKDFAPAIFGEKETK